MIDRWKHQESLKKIHDGGNKVTPVLDVKVYIFNI